MPTARQTASVPPAVVAPRAPCAAQAARSRGPTLRASGESPEALELLLGEPDLDDAVDDADRRGHGPGRADAPLGLGRDQRAFAAREAVRDERRLERDDGPAGLERRAHLRMDADQVRSRPRHQGIAPILATQRAAASSAAPGRRGGSRPRTRRRPRSCRRPPPRREASSTLPSASRTTQPRAPRLTTSVGASTWPTSARLGLVREDDLRGAALASVSRKRSTPHLRSPQWTRGRRSRAGLAAPRPGPSRGAASARGCSRGRAATRSRRARRRRARPARSSVATPRSLSIVRAPSGVAIETTVPVPASTSGPASSTPRPRSSSARIRPAGSPARLPRKRERPPSATTQAATFAAWPPAPTRVRP